MFCFHWPPKDGTLAVSFNPSSASVMDSQPSISLSLRPSNSDFGTAIEDRRRPLRLVVAACSTVAAAAASMRDFSRACANRSAKPRPRSPRTCSTDSQPLRHSLRRGSPEVGHSTCTLSRTARILEMRTQSPPKICDNNFRSALSFRRTDIMKLRAVSTCAKNSSSALESRTTPPLAVSTRAKTSAHSILAKISSISRSAILP
mmetsp:Transcript_124291/g.247763  ORF Transcript_124291/g.247763 Transcript_124291/m.247763 type:complete len:203 (-) Transcript_124291:77-685(-)